MASRAAAIASSLGLARRISGKKRWWISPDAGLFGLTVDSFSAPSWAGIALVGCPGFLLLSTIQTALLSELSDDSF